ISKQNPTAEESQFLSPEQFIDSALKRGSHGTSISFSEAATLMLEWNLDVFRLARKKGMFNTIVTNGYMTKEAIDLMVDAGLDAANVDVKGCEPEVRKICGIGLQPVLDNILHMKEKGIHVEVTTLVVPELSDTVECLDSISTWILESAGRKTPWHINFYHPDYKYLKQSPPLSLHMDARELAKRKGLEFVYIGNVGRRGLEDTICPDCDSVNVERNSFSSNVRAVDNAGNCANCGYDLAIRSKRDKGDNDD
ncbi:MAG: radical SAM protein, partial [Candidatus Thorarchaeota archaeon]